MRLLWAMSEYFALYRASANASSVAGKERHLRLHFSCVPLYTLKSQVWYGGGIDKISLFTTHALGS
jgi:hypothetical protein